AFDGENNLKLIESLGPLCELICHSVLDIVPGVRTAAHRGLDQCRGLGRAFVTDLRGRFEALEISLDAAAGTRQPEVLHDRGKRQAQVENPLPDLCTIGFGEKLGFRVPTRPQRELSRLIADPGDVSESFPPRKGLHPIKAESKL